MCAETTDEVFIFDNKGDQVTSVAMSRKTFCEIWTILKRIKFNSAETGKPMTAKDLAKVRAAGMIPMLSRSKRTEKIFDRFNAITDKLTGALNEDEPWVPEGEEK